MSVIGYSFYLTVNSASKNSHHIPAAWRIYIKASAAVLLFMFFIFSMLFFDMTSLLSMGQEIMKTMVSALFFGSSFIVAIIVRMNAQSLAMLSKRKESVLPTEEPRRRKK